METYQIDKLIILASLVLLILGIFIILYIVIAKRKQLLLQNKNIEQKKEFDATILQTQIEIQEQTLKTISQEIHDNIGQVLSLTKLTLSSIQSTDLDVVNKITTTKTLINKAIIDLKDISNSLNTDSIEAMGLIQAIKNEIDLINKTNIAASLVTNGAIEKLAPKTELILFRMVQECLNNAIKHAKAQQIVVIANYTINNFELIITDNGVGFNIEKINSKGLGLKNMQNRVKFIQATLNISSTFSGTEISIIIPKDKM